MPSEVNVRWRVSSCLLRALAQLVARLGSVQQRTVVDLSLVGEVLPTWKEVVLGLPTRFLLLGVSGC